MSQHNFSLVAGVIFLVMALAHLWRIAQGWGVVIEGYVIPMWISWVGMIVAGFLAYYGLRYGMRVRR
ncbi:MAG: hypothetical protein WCD70_11740 [Alphaproteobacteria bacterium]